MSKSNWRAMQDVLDAYNQVSTIEFLSEQLIEAVDNQDEQLVIDTAHALCAFLGPYTKNFDNKFNTAWNQLIKGE